MGQHCTRSVEQRSWGQVRPLQVSRHCRNRAKIRCALSVLQYLVLRYFLAFVDLQVSPALLYLLSGSINLSKEKKMAGLWQFECRNWCYFRCVGSLWRDYAFCNDSKWSLNALGSVSTCQPT